AAPTIRSSAPAMLPSCGKPWRHAIADGVSPSSLASRLRARKSPPDRSNWSPVASGKAPHSEAPAAAPTCPKLSIGTWTARSKSNEGHPTKGGGGKKKGVWGGGKGEKAGGGWGYRGGAKNRDGGRGRGGGAKREKAPFPPGAPPAVGTPRWEPRSARRQRR